MIVSLLLMISCGKSETIEDIQQRAGKTAESYYALLIEGKYADFVAGIAGSDSLPTSYREQMIDNTAMFVQQQKDEHQGIKAVTLSRCEADTASHSAQAFLVIEYADKNKEVVSVPLVSHEGIWYMK